MAKRLHRDNARKILIGFGAVAVGLTIAKVGTVVQGGGELPLRDYTYVDAAFADVGTLKPQQQVSQHGVRIGVVTDVSYRNGGAHVTMRLDGKREIYSNATARIGNASALGRKFVSIDPGTSNAGLLGGRELPVSQTKGALDLGNVLEAFPPEARQGLGSTLRNVGGGVLGHSDDLHDGVKVAPRLLDDAQTILKAVNSEAADLPSLLRAADRVVTQFNGHEKQLAGLIDSTGQTLGALNVDGTEPLRSTIQQAPETLAALNTNLRKVNPALTDTSKALRTLKPGVGDLVDSVGDVRGFLTESPPVARTVVKFAHDAVPGVKALVPAAADLRPVVQRLVRTLGLADPTLAILSRFAPDMGGLFANHNLLSGNYGPTKHYFAAELVFPGLYNAALPDPAAKVAPYEGPGAALAASGQPRGTR